MNKPTVKELAAELSNAYTLIIEALPLALKVLRTGAVELQDQESFWSAVRGMEDQVDLLDLDNEYPVADGLIERRDELFVFSLKPATEKPSPEEAAP